MTYTIARMDPSIFEIEEIYERKSIVLFPILENGPSFTSSSRYHLFNSVLISPDNGFLLVYQRIPPNYYENGQALRPLVRDLMTSKSPFISMVHRSLMTWKIISR